MVIAINVYASGVIIPYPESILRMIALGVAFIPVSGARAFLHKPLRDLWGTQSVFGWHRNYAVQ